MQVDDERVAFTQRAPVSSFGEPDVRFILERLTRGPEGVFDLSEGGSRLVAALVERSDSDANCATLIVLGLVGEEAARARLFARVVDRALELALGGPRERLRVPLLSGIAARAPALAVRGFARLFVSYTMRTDDARMTATPPTPHAFVDWSATMDATPVRDLVTRAFSDAPDVIPMSVEDLHERLSLADPTPRLLFDGAELVGLCRTTAPLADGIGRVPMIARDPSRRGQRLGDVLLVEAKRVLVEAGAQRFELEVATENRSALALYERHGFHVVSEESTWNRELGANAKLA